MEEMYREHPGDSCGPPLIESRFGESAVVVIEPVVMAHGQLGDVAIKMRRVYRVKEDGEWLLMR